MKKAYVVVTSWAGMSIGAVHHYGKLQWARKQEMELKRPLTQEEADSLNEKDSTFGSGSEYREGDLTNRFPTEDELHNKAIEVFKEKLEPKGYIALFRGDRNTLSPLPVIYGDEDFMLRANYIWSEYEDLSYYYETENDERLNVLQEDWSYLLKTFKPIVKFKLKMAHEESPEKTWIERYTEEDLKKWHCKTPEELGNVLISFFNGSLKRGEKARIFKGVEEKE